MLYLAYGSNLHPLRIILRVPSSRLVGTTKLDGYRLTFHKRSRDGSAKCNLWHSDQPIHTAYGAVFEISPNEKPLLDKAEGLGQGYLEEQLPVVLDGVTHSAYSYFASQSHIAQDLKPYDWYKRMVLAGARHHHFPSEYIGEIERVQTQVDMDAKRRLEQENILVQIES